MQSLYMRELKCQTQYVAVATHVYIRIVSVYNVTETGFNICCNSRVYTNCEINDIRENLRYNVITHVYIRIVRDWKPLQFKNYTVITHVYV